MQDTDPVRFYDLERYLFGDVHERFHRDGVLSSFDFFAIVIWKANRAKSSVARRLLDHDPHGRGDLEPAVADLTRNLYSTSTDEERLRLLIDDWGFRLPMATAILAVLWPENFSVYDTRVCDELGGFHKLGDRTKVAAIWQGYRDYLAAVNEDAPSGLSLRDKDRYLWARSVAEQLRRDVDNSFGVGRASAT